MPNLIINGVKLYYEVTGQGAPLVLLHGFGSSLQDWAFQRPVFEKVRKVVVLDFRGFGRSQRNQGPFTIEQMAADTLGLLDHLGVHQCELLGYSLGGAVAFQMALEQPGLFSRLVLVNTMPSFRPDSLAKILELLVRKAVVRGLSMLHMSRLIAKRIFPRQDQKFLREVLTQSYAGNNKEVYLSLLESMPQWSVYDDIQEIDIPTLVISSDHDYTPVAEKERYVGKMPCAQLAVIRNSRHGTPFDQPDLFNKVVMDFLEHGLAEFSDQEMDVV